MGSMSKHSDFLALFAAALLIFAPLLACKRRASPGHHSATPAPPTSTPAPAAATDTLPDDTTGAPVIDASRVTDEELCIKAGAPAAITKDTPGHLIGAM